jgi:hypothetical protein
MTANFSLNQIVNGRNAGTFVIVGFRIIDGELHAQVKAVNPKNHAQVARGEMALPVSALRAAA